MKVHLDVNTHTSVLLHELVDAIEILSDKQNIIVDATLGLAWHASLMIQKMNPGDIFIGFDADSRNLELAQDKLEKIQTKVQIILIHSNFEKLELALKNHGIISYTGIYYDLGVSSLHFDEAERWFSLRLDGPLDMRFDTASWKTAADILNYAEEKDLFTILKQYGEEPYSRKIAKEVVVARKSKKFHTTFDLTSFLDTHINTHIKTKMRVFQALRIEVNNELGSLESSLRQAIQLLEKNGNIFVISFHSLEDRIVKQYFKQESKNCICSDIICTCKHEARLKLTHKKPIIPSQEEQRINSRSRSAKARHAQKI